MSHKRTTVNKASRTRRVTTASRGRGSKLHVVHKPTGGWAVQQSGNRKATAVYSSQREAVAAARELALGRSVNVVVHRRDGTIRQEYRQSSQRSSTLNRPVTGFGCARGLITLAPDFDEPLADFADYS